MGLLLKEHISKIANIKKICFFRSFISVQLFAHFKRLNGLPYARFIVFYLSHDSERFL